MDRTQTNRCVLVCYTGLESNSGQHIVAFGRGLSILGWSVSIACPIEGRETDRFQFHAWSAAGNGTPTTSQHALGDGAIVHLWTPRAPVWRFLQSHAAEIHGPVIIHLEDDELELLSAMAGAPVPARPSEISSFLRRHALEEWTHPILSRCLAQTCDAATVLAPGLQASLPATIPSLSLRPPLDPVWFDAPDTDAQPKETAGLRTIVYSGAVHAGVRDDFIALCKAIRQLDLAGYQTTLVRTGPTIEKHLAPEPSALPERFVDLGNITVDQLRAVIGSAAVAVQPGLPTRFNRNRFPAKIAPYLASGAPVVMPSCYGWAGIRDGDQAVTFDRGTPDDLVQVMRKVLDQPEQSRSMAERARAFARHHFDVIRCAKPLDDLYRSLPNKPKTPWRRFRNVRAELPLLLAAERLSATTSDVTESSSAQSKELSSVIDLIETARIEMRDAETGSHHPPTSAQVYWPNSAGYTEDSSEQHMLRPGRWVRLRFGPHPIPRGRRPRFDPARQPGIVSLGSIVYRDASGHQIQRHSAHERAAGLLTSHGTITPVESDHEQVSRWLSTGEDPQLLLPAVTCEGVEIVDVIVRWKPLD